MKKFDELMNVSNEITSISIDEAKVKLSTKTEKIVLLGDGSAIDSIVFVNFIVELEELILKETKKNIPIKIDKIHSINTGKKKLTLSDFINAFFKIINAKE